MKFSDKLQKIRKENNITQEGLADKLNVSRQAVSKWESGSAYPDTEKLIQISKIFNIKIDELINDNIEMDKNKDINKKISYKEIINKILEFISNSINMFYSMKFMDKFKCILEMFILVLIFIFVFYISNIVIINIIRRILSFLPSNIMYFIINFFEALLLLLWLILSGMIIIKIFKSRYLDYYIFIKDDSIDKLVYEEPIKELKVKKEYRVVIRDPKDSSLNIFSKIGKIILFFIKCLGFIILIPLALIFIFLVMILVISLFYILEGSFFNGISLLVMGCILFIYILIEFIFNIIFNRYYNVNRMFILFIISIFIIGIGLGELFIAISNFEYEKNIVLEVNKHNINMEDNLIINEIADLHTNIIIDNSIDDIKINITNYDNINNYIYSYYEIGNDGNIYKVIDLSNEYSKINTYKSMINNLKNNKIIINDISYKIDLYVSEDNLRILKDNLDKYY